VPDEGVPASANTAAMIGDEALVPPTSRAGNALCVRLSRRGPTRGQAPAGPAQDTLSALSSSKKLVLKPRSVSAPVYRIVTRWPMKDFSE